MIRKLCQYCEEYIQGNEEQNEIYKGAGYYDVMHPTKIMLNTGRYASLPVIQS